MNRVLAFISGYKTYLVALALELFLCHGLWVGKFDANTWTIGTLAVAGMAGLKSGQNATAAKIDQVMQKADKLDTKVSAVHDAQVQPGPKGP